MDIIISMVIRGQWRCGCTAALYNVQRALRPLSVLLVEASCSYAEEEAAVIRFDQLHKYAGKSSYVPADNATCCSVCISIVTCE